MTKISLFLYQGNLHISTKNRKDLKRTILQKVGSHMAEVILTERESSKQSSTLRHRSY